MPIIRLWFDPADQFINSGRAVQSWVKSLPSRRWNSAEGAWDIYATGKDPDTLMRRAMFDVNLQASSNPSLAQVWSLGELYDPLCKLHTHRRGVVLVRPRLAGFEVTRDRLGPGARWDKANSRFEVPVTDLVNTDGQVKPGLDVIDESDILTLVADRRARIAPVDGVAALAVATSLSDAGTQGQGALAEVGDVPDWFGLDLYGYQRAGAIAAAGGHRLVADEQGLGKSRQALAAQAIADTGRLVIVSPPVMLTQWEREATASGVAGIGRTKDAQVVAVSARRKEPELPDSGVVVVADSVLAARPALSRRIQNWAPQGLIVDEAHRHKTWDSMRGRQIRELAEATDGLCLAVTGTPMFANPVELANVLAITGQLDPIFGGMGRFSAAFARQNKFKGWVARKNQLPKLRRILNEQVWVRRTKDQVLPDLPSKSRRELVVDVDLAGFRAAHREVAQTIGDWLDEFYDEHGHWPREFNVDAYARDSIGLTSRLRMAAGLAKVTAATDYITDWVESTSTSTDEQGRTVYDRPLIVWTHHRLVSDEMAKAVPAKVGGAKTIMGGISKQAQASIVDDFQAGLVPVLVASITAAGVGITLTRSCDLLFVETDWTPALVVQAEDRAHRISQERPVTVTTMVAPGTLDERVQLVLTKKARILAPVLGDGQNVAVSEQDDEATAPSEIIAEIAHDLIAKRAKKHSARAA